MPDLHHQTPTGFKPYRLIGVHVKDKFSKFFTVPEFEVGIVKAGWRGTNVEFSPTNEFADIEDDAMTVYTRLCARYGAAVVARFHPGPERLADDMQRYAETTATWLVACRKAAADEDQRRQSAEHASRLANVALAASLKAAEAKKA